ncbi:hypothetical protein [Serratia rubidaea]|uniref:hypothetical protein n=1 Tax=Serratia rubidaea TaxID=61652 RepID=UPI0013DEE15B|nr:hypothetical protein [Serratia rubidaea]MEB7584505.1 hypothetical protein [Serratia rubidaea]
MGRQRRGLFPGVLSVQLLGIPANPRGVTRWLYIQNEIPGPLILISSEPKSGFSPLCARIFSSLVGLCVAAWSACSPGLFPQPKPWQTEGDDSDMPSVAQAFNNVVITNAVTTLTIICNPLLFTL